MTGDKVTGVFYATRSDGVKLYRFAVPNTKHINEKGEEVWDKPQFKVRQDQTGEPYEEAIDVENAPYTYTETDIPVEGGDDMDEQRLREIENRLDQHDEDIEANAEGIQELAEIIGGGE